MSRLRLLLVPAVCLVLAAAYSISTATAPTTSAGSDWPTYLGNPERTGFNGRETTITPRTVSRLRLQWKVRSGGSIVIQPVVANGLIYWGSWDGYEYATHPSGKLAWATFLGQSQGEPCLYSTAGIASTATVATERIRGKARRVVYVGGGEPVFYALDALTGAVLWKARLGAPTTHFIWSSPAVYQGSVYVGVASYGDCPVVQGRLVQLSADTGTIRHTFDVVPAGCVGGAVWGSPAIDKSNGTLYFATGNPGRCAHNERLAESVIAIRASNLEFRGSWSVPESERTQDSDFGSTPTLFTATSGHVKRQLLGVVNKNGTYYALDRSRLAAGPVWRKHIAVGGLDPERGQGSVAPSAWDGTRLYVSGGNTMVGSAACKGSVRALEPATGAIIWEYCAQSGPVIGAVTAAPGLVAVGAGRSLSILSAITGHVLKRYRVRGRLYGAPSIADSALYVGDTRWYFYAFGL